MKKLLLALIIGFVALTFADGVMFAQGIATPPAATTNQDDDSDTEGDPHINLETTQVTVHRGNKISFQGLDAENERRAPSWLSFALPAVDPANFEGRRVPSWLS